MRSRRIGYWLVVFSLSASCAFAGIPRLVPIQGRLTDAAQHALNGSQTLVFTLYDASNTALWTSAPQTISVSNGVFSATLGDTTAPWLALAFDQPYTLGIKVGTDPEMTPRLPLSAVPTALSLAVPYTGQGTDSGFLLSITNAGDGGVLQVSHSATTGTVPVIDASTNSTDYQAVAIRGIITSTAPGSGSAAVMGVNNGTANLGVGVLGSQAGTGSGVYGFSPLGQGVYGGSISGEGVLGDSQYGIGVQANSDHGTGVSASSGTGTAASFSTRNDANTSDTLLVTDAGQGTAVHASASGTGRAGLFEVTNQNALFPALEVDSNGLAPAIGVTSTGPAGAAGFACNATGSLANALSVVQKGKGYTAEFLGQGATSPGVFIGTAGAPALVTQGGSVGIGVDNPVSALHIAYPTGITIGQDPHHGGYTALVMQLSQPTNGHAEIQSIAASGTTYGDLILNPTAGLVGIGTAAPQYELDVNGTIRGNNVSPSDARFKTNVAPLADPLATVLALRGVTFDWRRGAFPGRRFPEGRQVGFIAQEVEPVLPEVVSTDADGYKSVAYQNIVPVLVEGMKEQQRQIAALKAEKDAQITALQQQNAALETRLNRLESLLTR